MLLWLKPIAVNCDMQILIVLKFLVSIHDKFPYDKISNNLGEAYD